jgi:hypothetical protein
VTNEAFARVRIDQLLRDVGWRLTDGLGDIEALAAELGERAA